MTDNATDLIVLVSAVQGKTVEVEVEAAAEVEEAAAEEEGAVALALGPIAPSARAVAQIVTMAPVRVDPALHREETRVVVRKL